MLFFLKFVLDTPARCADRSPSCPNICNAGALNCSKILVAICIAVAWKEQGLTYFQRGTQRKGADSHWHLVKAIGLIQHFFYWTHMYAYGTGPISHHRRENHSVSQFQPTKSCIFRFKWTSYTSTSQKNIICMKKIKFCKICRAAMKFLVNSLQNHGTP